MDRGRGADTQGAPLAAALLDTIAAGATSAYLADHRGAHAVQDAVAHGYAITTAPRKTAA